MRHRYQPSRRNGRRLRDLRQLRRRGARRPQLGCRYRAHPGRGTRHGVPWLRCADRDEELRWRRCEHPRCADLHAGRLRCAGHRADLRCGRRRAERRCVNRRDAHCARHGLPGHGHRRTGRRNGHPDLHDRHGHRRRRPSGRDAAALQACGLHRRAPWSGQRVRRPRPPGRSLRRRPP